MAKPSSRAKRSVTSKRTDKQLTKRTAGKKARPKKTVRTKRKAPKKEVVSQAAITRAKRLEKLDAAPFRPPKKKGALRKALGTLKAALSTVSQRNPSFPQTYIQQVNVSLNDPMHAMTLTWTGPDAANQKTGPFHTSPGAGLRGLNCDDVATSLRSGTLCTPKGTFTVESFAAQLNSDARATNVTFFVRARGIGLHYFPTVPQVAASHGCVRIQDENIARLIHDNARAGVTKVVVDGTWTKPPKQW